MSKHVSSSSGRQLRKLRAYFSNNVFAQVSIEISLGICYSVLTVCWQIIIIKDEFVGETKSRPNVVNKVLDGNYDVIIKQQII